MKPNYIFNDKNQFVIEHYDRAKTFASFLPGIAGIDGIPMWAFYVNRGQVMGSFGVKDRNGTIMEFFPAHTMYQNIERKGFRTFVKYNGKIHEIFSSISEDDYNRSLIIEKNIVMIVEVNKTLGLKITVTYFTMPGESYAAMVRKVDIESLDGKNREIELLDGLPQLLPVGATNTSYQEMSNLMKSWYEVYNTENRIAFYKVRASTADTVEVSEYEQGNFFFSFCSGSNGFLEPIYDMDIIFGQNKGMSRPDGWDCTIEELVNRKQIAQNKVSGGFSGVTVNIGDCTFTLCSVIGHISSVDMINSKKADFSLEYINHKKKQAIDLVEGLVGDIFTKTAVSRFDKYIEQCYLDNLLRGGYPLVFKAGSKNHVYHVFSRKHGDLEREYNFFSLEPSLYSQGNGNFRDVSQNRRNDVLIKPEVKDFNVRHFMNLIQADGYNPLSVKGCTFSFNMNFWDEIEALLLSHYSEIKKLLSGKYTPGMLISFMVEHNSLLKVPKETFMEKALENSSQNFEADFGEGYWSDHWTYNMDLMDTYLAIYPDNIENFVFGDKVYCFYKSPVFVLPRSDKYVLWEGKVRQYGAIIEEKNAHQKTEDSWLKTENGKGEIYYTNLYVKLMSLGLIKFVSLDPEGMGIEIEAGKPGWNDALNGLSGLFGSSLCETAELLRIVEFIISVSTQFDKRVQIPVEIYSLILAADRLVSDNLASKLSDYEYWDLTASAKEKYRSEIRNGLTGKELETDVKNILEVFKRFKIKLLKGIEKALDFGNGVFPTYFTYQAVQYEIAEGSRNPVNGRQNVIVKEFRCNALPAFLEGPARILKTMKDKDEALKLYKAIRSSDLFDTKLEMYKTSVSLEGSSTEIGRLRAFTPGWLEREAIFLHMEYKYLLSMLQAGLYEQFFNDIRTMLVPFMKPEIYGRSTLENSSFIASSVNPDEEVHGRGFVARMSGSTAEMLSIWFVMMTGKDVFTYTGGELVLTLKPILPGWMFDSDHNISFKFLGGIMVNYFNPHEKNTYGEDSVKPVKYVLNYKDNTSVEVEGEIVKGSLAHDIRDFKVASIQVCLK